MNHPCSPANRYFKGRKLAIATKHEKEKVIGSLMKEKLGVSFEVPALIDTDIFGTFSGETTRNDDPITTARKKCELAMQLTNTDLAIASEGSFGTHPHLFFASADDEIIVLMDKKNKLEITARELSTSTNFDGQTICTEKQLIQFAEKALFPSHGLILKRSEQDHSLVLKDFTNLDHLRKEFKLLLSHRGSVFIETDMRAMMNPTRMKVIEKATQKLIEKIQSCCPECHTPGFSVTQSKAGLPCDLCGFPTPSTLYHLLSCAKCDFKRKVLFPHKKEKEEAMFCEHCNP
ncbi:DUF6671 family protein [Brumimicrobium oceani]|uniref:DUF6671 domain-containing protein n=1 Tax=Brumimicrobium oceani TaxID=2100725 RepID=A0A2U2XCZ9_9FLAO|nr:DUF6671 family protein [Brumimicrobium oceani]PWH85679.1 hypothetical protein DIT68_08575 [Brumimicrobium oceani]